MENGLGDETNPKGYLFHIAVVEAMNLPYSSRWRTQWGFMVSYEGE